MIKKTTIVALAGLLAGTALPGIANATVTVLGWPGGSEEAALRAATDVYNETAREDDKVELIFFSRDGFFDKLQADLAAGSDAFDINLIATYSIGRYAPYMEPINLGDDAETVFGKAVLETMQYEGRQYGVPTDLSLHFMYYRTDLLDALLGDEDARAEYSKIAEEYLGKPMAPKPADEWMIDS